MTEPNTPIRRPDDGAEPSVAQAEAPEPTLLQALLTSLAGRLGVQGIDQVWLFPPRQGNRTEAGLVVAAAFNGDDDRRRVVTARYLARRQDKGPPQVEEIFLEHAIAPTERIPAVIDGVLRRLDDDLAALPPRNEQVGGDPERWSEVVAGAA